MKKLGFVAIAVAAAAALAACGGGGGSSPAPTAAPTATATPTPTPAPTPGPVTLAYTTTFGVSSSAAAAPAALGFLAVTQTATLTAAESNYTGSFTAASSCTQVTVAPATSATGTFTMTAVAPAAAGCTITVTGSGTNKATVGSTVATPGGVVLRWFLPNYATQAPPVPQTGSPINIVGLGSQFAVVLAVSESNYVGGFPIANVTNGCNANATVAALAVSSPLPTAAPGNSVAYYTLTANTQPAATCNITAVDSYVPVAPATANPSASITVDVTSGTGVFN